MVVNCGLPHFFQLIIENELVSGQKALFFCLWRIDSQGFFAFVGMVQLFVDVILFIFIPLKQTAIFFKHFPIVLFYINPNKANDQNDPDHDHNDINDGNIQTFANPP